MPTQNVHRIVPFLLAYRLSKPLEWWPHKSRESGPLTALVEGHPAIDPAKFGAENSALKFISNRSKPTNFITYDVSGRGSPFRVGPKTNRSGVSKMGRSHLKTP